MAKLGPVQEQTMEEILASIRRMISDDDPGSAGPRAEPRLVETSRSSSNVARLFADEDDESGEVGEEADGRDNVVELAIAQAMEDAEAEARLEDAAEVTAAPEPEAAPPAADASAMTRLWGPTGGSPVDAAPGGARDAISGPRRTGAVAAPASLPLPEEHRQPLLSPRSDAIVSSAFDQLASTMLSGGARTIDQLVEDLLRPMLRNWLDMNLPPLVERLVREEIERVSRGRR